RLTDKRELVIIDPHRADRAFAKIKNLVTIGLAFARKHGQLVVAVQMVLVISAVNLLALLEFLDDIRIASRGNKGREPVEAGHEAVLHRVRRDVAGPTSDARHAEAAFVDGPLALCEWRRSAIGPGKEFGAVVGREHDDRVLVLTDVLELLHDNA